MSGALNFTATLIFEAVYFTNLDKLHIYFFFVDSGATKYCSQPYYGHFVIVINKLEDDTSDAELYEEIMGVESGQDERNDIRRKVRECFNGVSVRGLPYVNVPDGEEFGYAVLNDRFRDELLQISNKFIENLEIPRYKIFFRQIRYTEKMKENS